MGRFLATCLLILICLARVCTASFNEARAQSDEFLDDLLPSEASTDFIGDWKAFIEVMPRLYLEDRGAPGISDEQFIVWGETELDFRLAPSLTGYVRPRFYGDISGDGFSHGELPELYLTYAPGAWDLRGGILVENWGIADTFNPIDFLNPRDFATEILDPLKLGQTGVRIRGLFDGNATVGEPTLSFYWMPVFKRAQFAPSGQRFHPAPPGGAFDDDGGVNPRGADRMFWALRYQSTFNTALLNSDIQAIASRGPDRYPPIGAFPDGTLAPVYQRVDTAGIGFRAVPDERAAGHFLSTLTFKGEIAYRSFDRYDHSPFRASEDYWSYVFGFDKDFPNLFTDQDNLLLTLEYVGENDTRDAEQRLFQHDLVFRLLWQANDFDRTTLQLRGVLDPVDEEVILEASYTTRLRAISEDLRLELRYQYFAFERGSGTFLSRFPDSSSVSVGLRWDFAR